MKKINIIILLSALSIISCKDNSSSKKLTKAPKNITQKVDELVNKLDQQTVNYNKIAVLDHHRMAKELGVYTPPSIATIFSDVEINTKLITTNQLIGLDLPFKILCFSEPDTTKASIAYTSAEFIQKRHDLPDDLLSNYKSSIDKIILSFPKEIIIETNIDFVDKDFGIVKLKSDYNYTETLQNLKEIISAQNDTKWFAEIDYTAEARSIGVTIRPTILLLFGGPAPGGKAMQTTPRIGLDAFCQKLLVYEDENNNVWVSYNEIESFSKLYYNNSTKAQQMIDMRLKNTFSKAIRK